MAEIRSLRQRVQAADDESRHLWRTREAMSLTLSDNRLVHARNNRDKKAANKGGPWMAAWPGEAETAGSYIADVSRRRTKQQELGQAPRGLSAFHGRKDTPTSSNQPAMLRRCLPFMTCAKTAAATLSRCMTR